MLTTKLPESIAAYVDGANARDADAVAACFNEDAVVRDEGRERQGIAVIREWAEDVSRKYSPTVDVIAFTQANGRTIVTARVSGNFPGSPIELRYFFALHDKKIARLDIS